MKKKMKTRRQKKIVKTISIFFILIILIGSRYWYIKTVNHNQDLFGNVSTKNSDVFSIEMGTVKEVFVKENDFVQKDRLLVRIDCGLIDAKIKKIQTSLNYEKQRANLCKFKEEKTLEEYLNLKKDKTVEGKEINSKLKLLEEMQLLFKIQNAKIDMLVSEISYLKERKQKLSIKAPCSGRVTKLYATEGGVFSTKDKLLSIADHEQLWIDAKIRKKDLSKYNLKDSFNIIFEELKDVKFKGKIFDISPDIDRDFTNSAYIKLNLSINQVKESPTEKTYLLSPGMRACLKHE